MRQEFSAKTKRQALERENYKCQNCGKPLTTGDTEFHHDRECTMGGDNSLGNCIAMCRNCHGAITKTRAAPIAKSNRQRAKHYGLRRDRSGGWGGGRKTKFKKKLDGTIVPRKVARD